MPETLIQPLTISAKARVPSVAAVTSESELDSAARRRTDVNAPADSLPLDLSPDDPALSTQHSALPLPPSATSPVDALPEDDQEELLALYHSPHLTIFDIAARFSLRAADLLVWFERDDIRQRFDDLSDFSTRRASDTAAIQQTRCIAVFKTVIDACLDEEANIPIAPDTESRRLRHDQRTLAVRVAATLLRLTRTRAPSRAALVQSVAAVTSASELNSATRRFTDAQGPTDLQTTRPSPGDSALSTQHPALPLPASSLRRSVAFPISLPSISSLPISPFTCTNGHFAENPTRAAAMTFGSAKPVEPLLHLALSRPVHQTRARESHRDCQQAQAAHTSALSPTIPRAPAANAIDTVPIFPVTGSHTGAPLRRPPTAPTLRTADG
jgi:hypothetical protein